MNAILLRRFAVRLAVPALLAAPTLAQVTNSANITFSNGAQGFNLNGITAPSPTGGNPGACLHWDDPVDTFGLSLRNSTHPAFVGDYTRKGEVFLAVGVQVDAIQFFGNPVPRDLVVILYDDDPFDGADPAAVWTTLGTLDGNGQGWTNFVARVEDVLSETLPAGWEGAGAEDPVTFEPILPSGRTWANVLRGIDRIEFTTFVPGFFYGFTNFDVRFDNVRMVPVAGTWKSLGSAHPGVKGDPFLTAEGDLSGGSANSIALQNAAPNAFGGLLWSVQSVPQPFFGGTLIPFPFQDPIYLFTNASGRAQVDFTMPVGLVPGLELYAQFAIFDLAASADIALSNAAVGTVP